MFIVAVSSVFAQDNYLECSFTDGMPQDFQLYDVDQLEPSIDMKEKGFDVGKPWIVLEESDGNKAAVSTSWYRRGGTSDDWMITPPVTVGSETAVLRWRAKAGDKEYRDGYALYVAEDASTPDDFKKLSPVFSVNKEQADWTAHEVSLAEFAGKRVRIAFVNNTRDRATLYIDDIFAGVPAALEIQSALPRVINTPGKIEVTAIIKNISKEDVTGYTVGYRFGDGQFTEVEYSKTIKANRTVNFTVIADDEISRNSTLPYEIYVKCDKGQSSMKGEVSCIGRRVVAEEVTGTWCGYCVRGIVAMSEMKENYPDSFLGIAVHQGSQTWEDPMEYAEYSEYLFSSLSMPGYPHATVNRRKMYTGDPASIYAYYNQAMQREINAGVEVSVTGYDKETRTADLHSDIYFISDMEDIDYSLGYVLIENDVHKDAVLDENGKPKKYNGYEQNNYYAGGSMGEMGGFENLASVVPGPDMTFQDVARAFWGDGFGGFEGSVPSSVKADTHYSHDYTITLPDNVLDDRNLEIAVLLFNNKTGEILNADAKSMRAAVSAAEMVEETASDIFISAANGNITVASAAAVDAVEIYGIDGSRVTSLYPGDNEITVDMSGMKGIFIVRAVSDSRSVSRKVIL